VFHGNTASGSEGRGGAVHCTGTSATSVITNSLFTENSATLFGGALWANSPLTATNCTFVGNSAGNNNAVAAAFSSTLINCIAQGNINPGGVPVALGNTVQFSLIEGVFSGIIVDCCQANGTPGCSDADCEALICALDPFCCDTEWDSICAGAANEQCDVCAGDPDEPIFVDPTNGDFRLVAGSPGIDAGSATLLPITIDTDFSGNPRVVNGLESGALGVPVFGYYIDMGAFEFQPDVIAPPTCLGDINGDGVIDAGDLGILLNVFGDVCP
jgi:hypothetical protein